MRFRGRITESETRARSVLDGAARPWRVTSDPSNMFQNSTFRVCDLSAGGFDLGTTFIHIRTGETCVVGADGIIHKVSHEKTRRRRKKIVFVKPAKQVIGSGGTNAVL